MNIELKKNLVVFISEYRIQREKNLTQYIIIVLIGLCMPHSATRLLTICVAIRIQKFRKNINYKQLSLSAFVVVAK